MIEIYTGRVGTIYLTTYEDGLPTAPDSNPTVVVTDAATGQAVVSGSPTIIDSDYPGEYQYRLPASATSFDRVLKVVWSYTISSRLNQEIEYVYVSTPYATPDEISAELGFSSRPEDANYYSYEKIVGAERVARMMIDNYLGFSISKSQGSVVAYGSGADVLLLPARMISVTSLKENDELVVDSATDYNILGFDIELTETSYGLRIVPPNPGDDIDEQEEFDYTGLTKGRFRDGYRYEVSGIVGWDYVPAEVKQSAFLLVNDLLCSDSIWRTRYVKKINSGQLSVEISGQSHFGTGNAIVDAILQKFRMIQAVII
jgi:hypothetical protein